MKALVCIDVQNDFVTGDLATPGAEDIAKKIIEYAKTCRSKGYALYATADTHRVTDWRPESGKETTLEAKFVPEHCIDNTYGHQIVEGLVKDADRNVIIPQGRIFDKSTFGSEALANQFRIDFMESYGYNEPLNEIILCGFVTGICVLANALLLRTFLPNVKITVKKDLCGDMTEEYSNRAFEIMRRHLISVE